MNPSLRAILDKKSIMEYLEDKGIRPARTLSGGKFAYYCPLPDHDDKKTPSFIVWTNADYENFYCFGCQRGYTIVHLISYMENISYKEVISRLAKSLDISIAENIDYVLDSLRETMSNMKQYQYAMHHDLAEQMLSISSLCYSYLYGVDFNEVEQGIMERFWAEIDKSILEFNFSVIEEALKHLPTILFRRRKKFEDLQKEEQRKTYASKQHC